MDPHPLHELGIGALISYCERIACQAKLGRGMFFGRNYGFFYTIKLKGQV